MWPLISEWTVTICIGNDTQLDFNWVWKLMWWNTLHTSILGKIVDLYCSILSHFITFHLHFSHFNHHLWWSLSQCIMRLPSLQRIMQCFKIWLNWGVLKAEWSFITGLMPLKWCKLVFGSNIISYLTSFSVVLLIRPSDICLAPLMVNSFSISL